MVFKEVLTVIHCTHWTLAPPAPLPPSRPTPRSKRGTSLSLGHYSIMLGWVDGGKVQSGGESRAAREAFFAGGLRLRPFKRPSSSLYVSLSCLSASPVPPSLAISARSFVRPQPWQPWPSPSTPLFLPLASSHPYVSGTGHNGLRDGPVGRPTDGDTASGPEDGG